MEISSRHLTAGQNTLRKKHVRDPLRKSGAVSWDTRRVWGDTALIWGRPYLWRCERLASNNAETRDYMQCMAKQATMCNKRYWESAHCESTTKPSTIFDAETWKRWNFFLLLHNMPKHLMKSKWCSSMHKYAQVCTSMLKYAHLQWTAITWQWSVAAEEPWRATAAVRCGGRSCKLWSSSRKHDTRCP